MLDSLSRWKRDWMLDAVMLDAVMLDVGRWIVCLAGSGIGC